MRTLWSRNNVVCIEILHDLKHKLGRQRAHDIVLLGLNLYLRRFHDARHSFLHSGKTPNRAYGADTQVRVVMSGAVRFWYTWETQISGACRPQLRAITRTHSRREEGTGRTLASMNILLVVPNVLAINTSLSSFRKVDIIRAGHVVIIKVSLT